MRLKFSSGLFIIFSFFVSFAFGQLKGLPFSDETEFSGSETQSSTASFEEVDSNPVGNDVDPDLYKVGPGDVLSLQILNYSPYPFPLIISSDNQVLLPRIGAIDLSNRTLSETRDLIKRTVTERTGDTNVFVSLYKARIVLVEISGDAAFAGVYSFPASYTVSSALAGARAAFFGEAKDPRVYSGIPAIKQREREERQIEDSYGVSLPDYALRNILVLGRDGESKTVDIPKSKIEGNEELDPYLREGDKIVVPFEPDEFSIVSISGEVARPATFPYKSGDKISDLLAFGFGPRNGFDAVYLVSSDGNKQKLDTDEKLNLLSGDGELEPGESIVVTSAKVSKDNKIGAVTVSGEVLYPGSYAVRSGRTRLSEVIENAGGLTEDAYAPLGTIVRDFPDDASIFNYRNSFNEGFKNSDLALEDTLRFFNHVSNKTPYVSCDFSAALQNPGSESDVVLISGDKIKVPKNPGHVYVFGRVKNPGYVAFAEGKTCEYYVERAGGATENAEIKRLSIIRGPEKIWLGDEPIVLAGDEIYVPGPPDIPPAVELQRYSLLISTVSVLMAIANLVIFVLRT